MRHHALTAAIGTVLAAALLPLSATSASAADPTGYWRKAEQRSKWPGKMLIYRCGPGKRYMCVKIAWVKNPFDDKGNPLRDILNSNTSLRKREIVGLPIARNMAKVAGNQWKGSIYNPEDGNTYSATLTLASRSKIILKGCKAFLLCGERVWVRTSPPPKEPEPEVKPEEQIEAKAELEAAPVAAAETASAAAPEAGTNIVTPAVAASKPGSMGEAQMMTPAAQQSTQPGYHFLNSVAAAPTSANFTGNDVPSMFHMTKPLDQNTVAATESAPAPAAQLEPVAQPKPQMRTIEANAAPAPPPQPKPTPPQAKPKAAPKPVAAPKPAPAPKPVAAPKPAAAPEPEAVPDTEAAEVSESTETADATDAAPSRPLTWRERRKLRRQQRLRQTEGMLPWVRQ